MKKRFYFLLVALLWCGAITSAMSQNKTKPQAKPTAS